MHIEKYLQNVFTNVSPEPSGNSIYNTDVNIIDSDFSVFINSNARKSDPDLVPSGYGFRFGGRYEWYGDQGNKRAKVSGPVTHDDWVLFH